MLKAFRVVRGGARSLQKVVGLKIETLKALGRNRGEVSHSPVDYEVKEIRFAGSGAELQATLYSVQFLTKIVPN